MPVHADIKRHQGRIIELEYLGEGPTDLTLLIVGKVRLHTATLLSLLHVQAQSLLDTLSPICVKSQIKPGIFSHRPVVITGFYTRYACMQIGLYSTQQPFLKYQAHTVAVHYTHMIPIGFCHLFHTCKPLLLYWPGTQWNLVGYYGVHSFEHSPLLCVFSASTAWLLLGCHI